jgi:acid stress-induced BolA-like protein IbaG/YrbA
VAGHLALPEVRRVKGGTQGGKERGMRVLVACECSGAVRRAFRARGHDAWSCDLQPADDGSQYHFQGDALGPIGYGWDLMIAHPPCTHLSVEGDGRHFFATIVSTEFEGLSRVRRHQRVYAALGERMREQIHALSMKTLTPTEHQG